MSLEEEIPAILKPDGNEDPRDHITFHGEVPVGRTALGRKTIAVLGLDLEAHEPRRTHLKAIMDARERYINLMKSADPIARRWAERDRQFLQEAVRPEQPYSAMVAVYLEANPLSDPSCLIP